MCMFAFVKTLSKMCGMSKSLSLKYFEKGNVLCRKHPRKLIPDKLKFLKTYKLSHFGASILPLSEKCGSEQKRWQNLCPQTDTKVTSF